MPGQWCGRRWPQEQQRVMSRQRITKSMLEDAIAPQRNGYVRSLAEIGQWFGVSRERIRQRLGKVGLRKPRSDLAPLCPKCARSMYKAFQDGQACRYCDKRKSAPFLWIKCSECDGKTLVRASALRGRLSSSIRRGNGPRKTPFFCSKHCYGRWVGRNHGFAAHPENRRRKAEGAI